MALSPLTTLEICAGVGMLGEGLRAGLRYLGCQTRTVCYIEREAYAAAVLAARCQEQSLDDAPIWSDLLSFDGAAWRGAVDCIIAGFPCQDLSVAGRRAGLDGKRSGLFFDILQIADDCQARWLFLENVAGISTATASAVDAEEGELEERAAARVLGELASSGWDAQWLTLRASDVGASHGRARWFCFAWRRESARLDDTEGGSMRINQHHERQSARDDDSAARPSQPMAHTGRNGSPERPQGRCSHGARESTRRIADHHGDASTNREQQLGNTQHDGQPTQPQLRSSHQAGHHGRQEESPAPRQPARADRSTHDASLSRCADAGECTADLGNARSQPSRAQRPHDELGRASASTGAGQYMANSHSAVSQGRRKSDDATGWQEPDGHAGLGIRELAAQHSEPPLFAPGPSDPRWPAIIAEHPYLAPSLPAAFDRISFELGMRRLARGFSPGINRRARRQSASRFAKGFANALREQKAFPDFRGAVNGMAFAMDESRAERLKCGGNGVVALQAAAAFVQLFRRAQGVSE